MSLHAIRELNLAITLDSNFAEAWGTLTTAHGALMNAATNDSSVEPTTREIFRVAMRRARQNPEVLLNAAYIAHVSDKNRATAEGVISKALSF